MNNMSFRNLLGRRYISIEKYIVCEKIRSGPILYLNPKNFRDVVQQFQNGKEFYFYVDGYWFSKILNFSMGWERFIVPECFDFSGNASILIDLLVDQKKKVLFCGGDAQEIVQFEKFVKGKYNIALAVFEHGYQTIDSLMEVVKAEAIEIVVCSLGTGKQEEFGFMCLRKTITCGAFISQTARSGERFYPKWAIRLKLRFAYRCLTSRRHLLVSLRGYFVSALTIVELLIFGKLVVGTKNVP